jgi:hypothetical protein
MTAPRRRAVRAITVRSVKWLLFLAAPFSLLFFETWLRLRTVETDYVSGALRVQIRDLHKSVDGLEARIDGKKTMPRLDKTAANLGLIQPEPGQVETIYARATDEPSPTPAKRAGLEVACLDSP